MLKMKKKNAGFTLIEFALVIILLGIIAGFVGTMLYQETKMFFKVVPRKEAKIESKLVMERIQKDLRYAYRNRYTTGSNVKFKVPINFFKGYTTVNIYLSTGKLYLKTGNNSPEIIADNVSFFNITSVRTNYTNYTTSLKTRNLVKVKLIITKEGNDIEHETTVFLRN